MKITAIVFVSLLVVHLAMSVFLYRQLAKGRLPKTAWQHLVLPVYPLIVLVSRLRRHRNRWTHLMAALQTLLFLAGLYLGSRHGVFGRQLVSPLAIGLGLIAGHLIFGISLTVTHRSIGDVAGHLIDLGPLWDYIVDNPRVLMQFLNVSIAEEVIYRAGAQPIVVAWLGPWAGIIVVAIVFSLIHEHFFKNAPGQSAEFLAFAILLGILFYWTGNLTLVVAIHAVRNIEIAFIERLVRDDEVKEKGEQPATEEEYLSGECVLTTIVLPGNCDPVWLEWSEETPAAPAPAICGFRQRFQG